MNTNTGYSSGFENNKDYIQYVCSKDIREYLYEINFRITDVQAFFLIDHCTHINFEEKLTALKSLYAECEDFVIDAEICGEDNTFKRFFREAIKGREKSHTAFYDNSEGKYLYAVYKREKCYNQPRNHIYLREGYVTDITTALNELTFKDCDYIKIVKIRTGTIHERNCPEVAVAYYSQDKVLLEIDDNYANYSCYQDFCIYLPLPFKRGDILALKDNYRNEENQGCFVYDSCSLKSASDIKNSYDFTDNYLLLYKEAFGYPFADTFINTFDCEYSRIPLSEDEQKLKPFSLFLKEVINIGETIEWFNFIDNQNRKQKLHGLVEQYIPEIIEDSRIEL